MKNIILSTLALLIWSSAIAQIDSSAYKRAEQFIASNLRKKLYRSWVNPQWDKENDLLWYTVKTRKGLEYIKVDLESLEINPLFDQIKLANQFKETLQDTIHPYKLPISSVKIVDKGNVIHFKYKKQKYSFNLSNSALKELVEEGKVDDSSSESPDKSTVLSVRNYNIWLKTTVNDSVQITKKGTQKYGYGVRPSWYSVRNIESKIDHTLEIDINWSPDNRYAIVGKYDRRHARNLYLYKSHPEKGNRAEVYSYERPLAGDSVVPTVEYILVDTKTNSFSHIDLPPAATFLCYDFKWNKEGDRAYQIRYHRGYKSMELMEVNTENASHKTIYSESSDTYVDPLNDAYKLLEDGSFLFLSEQDGWNHIYRYDIKSGKLIQQITSGEYVIRSIEHADLKSKTIYFTAGGKEPGCDPYLPLFYKVDFNGKNLELLTPEQAHHTISINHESGVFVDNFSTIQEANIAVLRDLKDGSVLKTLEQADYAEIEALGWEAPEPFKAKGRDGETDIYGVIYKPANFNPTKSYPIIEGTYSGPQTIRSPKTFSRGLLNDDTPLTQLDFVLINIDGMGTAFRSKAFHDVSYKNLGDIGAADKITVIKTLANNNPWMDTTRIGIFGHSAGGYDAARALLTHPDFYKVGVATAGNHDHRAAKAWWPELYMGYPVEKHYDEQSNYTHAKELQGFLMLVHGEMDQNVNPTASQRLASELIKANKNFELLIIPNKDHSTVYYDKYLTRKRWDFFVKHLHECQPPREFKIK